MGTGMMKLCGTNGKVYTDKIKQHYPEGKELCHSSIITGIDDPRMSGFPLPISQNRKKPKSAKHITYILHIVKLLRIN
jgi:hypothetical protein